MSDIEVGLLALLDDLGDTVTVTPSDLKTRAAAGGKVIRARRIGGGSDRDADYPTVSIQCMASETQATPRAAHDLNQAVENRFLDILNGNHTGWVSGVLIENPSKTSGPVELPYPDPTITVVESIYRLTVRQ